MFSCCSVVLLLGGFAGQDAPLLQNADFEQAVDASLGADGRVNGWKIAQPGQIPEHWTPNPAYPGELSVPSSAPGAPGAQGGNRFVRLTASSRDAHLYQMCEGLDPAKWYRVSLYVRGGPVSLSFYEYLASGKIGGQTVLQSAAGDGDWQRREGYYRPPSEGYLRSALAISVPPGQAAEVDDVAIEPLDLPAAPSGGEIVFETGALRLAINSQGLLGEFRAKSSGTDYAVAGTPVPILHAVCRGVATPLHSLVREGDLLRAQFLDSEVRATLRVAAAEQHLRFEVVDVQPKDLDELTLRFPIRRLDTVAGAFNGTYDQRFGVCLFGVSENTCQQTVRYGADVVGLTARCTGKHGIVGARFALVAAPRERFEAAIIEAEIQNGLPAPMLEGRWARSSEPVRRSYLFVVDAKESNVERIIEYAQLGNFKMIIFLKNNWLSTHGHFQINEANFPGGVASLKRAVEKIHAAGIGAGVHVFGPSISPNDPYITPKPDERLAFVPCPPLAEAVDAAASVLPLSGEPNLPPKTGRSDAFPGYHIRIGDEIVRYQQIELGPAPRLVGCQRGSLGTRAAAHAKGAEVKGLLTMWSFFLVDPDSTLADELTSNFAEVFNECDFDMVYFDASDGISDQYLDRWYYLNKLHLGYYRKFKKDVLYQTSNGTGSNLVWHIVPRSASADGHGDLKQYLDERLPGMLGMADNFTRPDVGWYYMFDDVRPDQIEYVCTKTIGLDGSISIETSLGTMDRHPRARQMIETVGRYERCRLARYFSPEVCDKLSETGKDFKLLPDGDGWKLYRAVYEQPRYVESLDGQQNVWTIRNDLPVPCWMGVEIVRGSRGVPTSDYDQAGAVTVEAFDDASLFGWIDDTQARRYVPASDATITASGAAKAGVSVDLEVAGQGPRAGGRSLVLTATNGGPRGGWCAVARNLPQAVDLSGCQSIAMWIDGDGSGADAQIKLSDVTGRSTLFNVQLGFQGWRLCIFPTASAPGLDWAKISNLLISVQRMAGGVTVRVGLDGLRGLPKRQPAPPLVQPAIEVNGTPVPFPVRLNSMQAVTSEGPGGTRFWPGGMQAGEDVRAVWSGLLLQPGENRIVFSADAREEDPGASIGSVEYPGDVNVLLYRMWPMEE